MMGRPKTAFSWFFNLVLCCAAWGGPIPILHHHSSYEMDDRGQAALIEHMRLFHYQDVQDAPSTDWHWHLTSCEHEGAMTGHRCPDFHPMATNSLARTSEMEFILASQNDLFFGILGGIPIPIDPGGITIQAPCCGSFLLPFGVTRFQVLTSAFRC